MIKIYTDGSCIRKSRKWWLGSNHINMNGKIKKLKGSEKNTTNNQNGINGSYQCS